LAQADVHSGAALFSFSGLQPPRGRVRARHIMALCRCRSSALLLGIAYVTFPAWADRSEDILSEAKHLVASSSHASDRSARSELHTVEIRQTSMRLEPVMKANLLEVSEKFTAPTKPYDQATIDKLPENDPRRKFMEMEHKLGLDEEQEAAHIKHQEGYQALTAAADKFHDSVHDSKFSIHGTIEKAGVAQEKSTEVAVQMARYAENLKRLQQGGQHLVNNIYTYHSKVDHDISKAVQDATLPKMSEQLEGYYALKGGSSQLHPMGTGDIRLESGVQSHVPSELDSEQDQDPRKVHN